MTGTTSDIEILTERENARYAASLAADSEGFRELACAEMTYAHTNGSRDTLDEYLDKLVSGSLNYHSIEHPITEVLVAGDAAVVVGEMRADLTVGGIRKTLNNACIAVWVKRDDQWRLLAYQPTPKLVSKEQDNG